MARVTLGDIVVGSLLTAGLMLGVLVVVSVVMFVALGSSERATMEIVLIAACSVLLVGGIHFARIARKLGYDLVRPMALGFGLVLLAVYLPMWAVLASRGELASTDPTLTLYSLGFVVLWVFFVVGLAAILNSRYPSLGPAKRTFGSAPGQLGTYIYKSNQPAVYEGIRSLEFESDAPESVYRKQQTGRL